MRVEEVLERYVRDVANQLPIRMRSDVALELASLLREELRAKAERLGVAPDEKLAIEVVRDYGKPNEVAARYHPKWAIIDPSDTRNFLLTVIVGGAVLVAASVPAALLTPAKARGVDSLLLWWIGAAVVFFGLKSWMLRRWPDRYVWKPKPDPDQVSRLGMIGLILLIGVAMEIYADPQRTFAMLTGNPQLGAWLQYDAGFRSQRMPWLFVVWVAQAAMLAVLAIRGRWTPLLRQVDLAIAGATIVLIAWFRSGPIMSEPTADQTARAFLAMIALFLLIGLGLKVYRGAGQVSDGELREALTR